MNEQILTALSKTKHSMYSRVNETKFRSDIVRYKKVFVILDGTIVFNVSTLHRHFVDMKM